jgi:D-alanine-D-alanine ligase
MCERLIEGRELTISILGNTTLPAVEILPSEGFYDFDAKYRRDDTTYTVDPPLEKDVARTLARWSMELAGVMGLRDLCRVDWLLDGNDPWLLEVNTMPGMTSHSLLPQAAAAKGIDMTELCSIAVGNALQRAGIAPQPKGG